MRIVYIPERDYIWEQYYKLQASQSGHGISGFEGTAFQRGSGLGNFLGRIFRSVLPVIKSVGKRVVKTVGKEALSTGASIAGDYARGRNLKAAARQHSRKALENLADKTAKLLKQNGAGLGRRQSKKSTVKAPIRKRKPIVKKRRAVKRLNTSDIFNQ